MSGAPIDPVGEQGPESGREPETTGPVIRDKRRLDPETGQVRPTADPEPTPEEQSVQQEGDDASAGAAEGAPSDEAPPDGDLPNGDLPGDELSGDLHPDSALAADRLEDLRRLQAEYVNYKRRVDRDRARDQEVAVGGVVEAMLPVLDDIHSARQHGDLAEGPFAAIADKLESTLGRFGVERFGEPGQTFDPTLHEALMHLPDADLPEGTTETTIVQVVQPGFKVGERLVRAARVAVADP